MMEIENKDREPLKVRLPESRVKTLVAEGTVLTPIRPKTDDEMGQYFLDKVFAAEPAWKERDEACTAEWGLSPAQRVVRYITIVLDQQAHLNLVPGYDFPEQGSSNLSPMQGECPQCHKEFNRQFPGQVCCSNACGEAHFPKPVHKVPEYDNSFNETVAAHLDADVADGPPMAAFPVGSGIR